MCGVSVVPVLASADGSSSASALHRGFTSNVESMVVVVGYRVLHVLHYPLLHLAGKQTMAIDTHVASSDQ